MIGRATVALALALAALAALPACNRERPDDPIAAAGEGIPMGAVGAVGVAFDAPPPPSGEPAPPPRRRLEGKHRRLPPDPFADPPDTSGGGSDGGPASPPRSRPSGGTAL